MKMWGRSKNVTLVKRKPRTRNERKNLRWTIRPNVAGEESKESGRPTLEVGSGVAMSPVEKKDPVLEREKL